MGHPCRGGEVKAEIAGVGDEKQVFAVHEFVQRQQPGIVQGEALDIRVELDAHQAQGLDPLYLRFKIGVIDMHGPHTDERGVLPAAAGDKAVDALHLPGRRGGGKHHGAGDPGRRVPLRQIRRGSGVDGELLRGADLVGTCAGVKAVGGRHGGRGDLFRKNMHVRVNNIHISTSFFLLLEV